MKTESKRKTITNLLQFASAFAMQIGMAIAFFTAVCIAIAALAF